MGLFINNDRHPDVFRNNIQIDEPNQKTFKSNHLTEMLEQQQKTNEDLQHSFNELKDLYEKQSNKQTNQMRRFGNRLYELKKGNLHIENNERLVMESLRNLDEKNAKIQATLDSELLVKQEVMDKMNNLSRSHHEVVNRLDKAALANQQLELKVDEQLDLQKQISQHIASQEDTHSAVLKRLETQEALTEKVLRQIDYFRSVLFERTNHLAEKIDNGYNHVSLYLTKLMTEGELPLARFKVIQKPKENKRSSE